MRGIKESKYERRKEGWGTNGKEKEMQKCGASEKFSPVNHLTSFKGPRFQQPSE
jgi:hypothetical protein